MCLWAHGKAYLVILQLQHVCHFFRFSHIPASEGNRALHCYYKNPGGTLWLGPLEVSCCSDNFSLRSSHLDCGAKANQLILLLELLPRWCFAVLPLSPVILVTGFHHFLHSLFVVALPQFMQFNLPFLWVNIYILASLSCIQYLNLKLNENMDFPSVCADLCYVLSEKQQQQNSIQKTNLLPGIA